MTGLVGVAVLVAMRWALADFLLDRFGSPRTDWTVDARPEPSEPVGTAVRMRGHQDDDHHRPSLEGLG